jgi:hypothetical protein
MSLSQSPLAPFIYIDVEAAERQYQQNKKEMDERWELKKIKDAAEVSICVSSNCPLLSHRLVRGKGKEEWCLSGNAHLQTTSWYNDVQHRAIIAQCEYAEKRK